MTGNGKGKGNQAQGKSNQAQGKGNGKGQAQKAKAAPKKSAAAPQSRPRGARGRPNGSYIRIYDPEVTGIPPTILPSGKAVSVDGLVRLATNPLNNRGAIFVSGVSGTSTVACNVNTSVPAVGVGGLVTLDVPTLTSGFGAGGPTSSRCSKISLHTVNTTSKLNLGGRVYIGVFDQRLKFPNTPSLMTQAEWQTVFDTLIGHPNTMEITTMHGMGVKKLCHVVDTPDYENYETHVGSINADTFFAHIANWTGSNELTRGMSTTVFIFDQPPVTQNLLHTVRAQHLTRWPVDTVLGQQMKMTPVANPSVVTEQRVAAEVAPVILHPRPPQFP